LVLGAGLILTLATLVPALLQLRRHPRGLVVLFAVEMWERFSYYGMRALLIFYLTQHFLVGDRAAAATYATYTALISLTPLAGAVLADRILGTRKAVAFGALLLVIGHLAMAFESPPAQDALVWRGHSFPLVAEGRAANRRVRLEAAGQLYAFSATPDGGLRFEAPPRGLPALLEHGDYRIAPLSRPPAALPRLYLALATIIVGVGMLKTSPLVAQLYAREDPRRDAGFTLFYYAVNLGAFWAALVCGWLGMTVGWWAGFRAAACGMAAGYLVFRLGAPWLAGCGDPPAPARLARPLAGPLTRETLCYACALTAIPPLAFILGQAASLGPLLLAVSVLALGYLAVYMARRSSADERRRLGLALVLMLGSIVFWTLFEQAGSSLNLFAERHTALELLARPIRLELAGRTLFLGSHAQLATAHLPPGEVWWIDSALSAPQTQAFNPGFILLLAPAFAALWPALERSGRGPSILVKFGLALLLVGAGFLLLAWSGRFADASFRTPVAFLAGAYLLNTIGELLLSPVGVSAVSRLAPSALTASIIGLWSLSVSWAQFIGGKIAALTAADTAGGQVLDPQASLQAALQVFAAVGLAGVGCGLLFLAGAFVAHRRQRGQLGAAPQPLGSEA
jgi:POT family proton-dependent oligopeptide transporter